MTAPGVTAPGVIAPVRPEGEETVRCIAIDWSGATSPAEQRRKIRIADTKDGRARLVPSGVGAGGFTRDEAVAWLLANVQAGERAVIGLDFAFSFPRTFVERLEGVHGIADVWRRASHDGSAWLRGETEPFWGRAPRPKRTLADEAELLRRTELEVGRLVGRKPASVFLLCGAQQVGPASIRGMPRLLALRERGFAVWPFDDGWPRIVEIWPAVHTGLRGKRLPERERWLAERPFFDEEDVALALLSDDAFDALASAHDLALHAGAHQALRASRDPVARIEGEIWTPPHLTHGRA